MNNKLIKTIYILSIIFMLETIAIIIQGIYLTVIMSK